MKLLKLFALTLFPDLISREITLYDVFAYLIHLGYLAYDSDEQVCWIPNNEVRFQWINAIKNLTEHSSIMQIIIESHNLLENIIALNETAIADALNKCQIIISNTFTYNNEET